MHLGSPRALCSHFCWPARARPVRLIAAAAALLTAAAAPGSIYHHHRDRLTGHQLHRQIAGESGRLCPPGSPPPPRPDPGGPVAHCWAVAAIHGRRRTQPHGRVARAAAAPQFLTAPKEERRGRKQHRDPQPGQTAGPLQRREPC
jgi:hypothetical protein